MISRHTQDFLHSRLSEDKYKGLHSLKLGDIYDIRFVHDPQAKKSARVRICVVGDNDAWFEKLIWRGDEWISFFISRNTGRRVRDEPPTGASRVFYLTNMYRNHKMRERCN